MSPKISQIKSWTEWFDRTAQHYQDARMKMAYFLDAKSGTPVPNAIMKATYKDTWRRLKANRRHSILDVGCGVGLFIQLHQHKAKKIIGTDIAFQMTKDAKNFNSNGLFLTSAAYPLPFKSQSFDRILCYSVFHYVGTLANAKKIIDEFIRIVKKDGIILIGDILTDTPRTKITHNQSTSSLQKDSQEHSQKPWWPKNLSHQLTKLRLKRKFFLEYCQKKKYHCEILEQKIPGRIIPEIRYDVRIRP